MSTHAEFSYHDYVSDRSFMDSYRAYQARYAQTPRESDRVLVELVREISGGQGTLADVGCSTGNLLLHLRKTFPDMDLHGGDLVADMLDMCRATPALEGVTFHTWDITDLPATGGFDAVVVNAVLYMMDEDQWTASLASLRGLLKPGGWLLVYDFFHGWEQELSILEKSETHPEGLMIHVRTFDRVGRDLATAGFGTPDFRPFSIPLDLPEPERRGDMGSYTRASEAGRLIFRGSLFQPWCHLKVQAT